MNLKETSFWCAIYWALYLTVAVVLWGVTGVGELLPIFLIGVGLTSVLAGVLTLMPSVQLVARPETPSLVIDEPKEELVNLEVKPHEEKPVEEVAEVRSVDNVDERVDVVDDAFD